MGQMASNRASTADADCVAAAPVRNALASAVVVNRDCLPKVQVTSCCCGLVSLRTAALLLAVYDLATHLLEVLYAVLTIYALGVVLDQLSSGGHVVAEGGHQTISVTWIVGLYVVAGIFFVVFLVGLLTSAAAFVGVYMRHPKLIGRWLIYRLFHEALQAVFSIVIGFQATNLAHLYAWFHVEKPGAPSYGAVQSPNVVVNTDGIRGGPHFIHFPTFDIHAGAIGCFLEIGLGLYFHFVLRAYHRDLEKKNRERDLRAAADKQVSVAVVVPLDERLL